MFDTVASTIILAGFFAGLNKSLLDLIVAPVYRKWPSIDLWWFDYVALVTGVALAFIFKINLLESLAINGNQVTIGASLLISGLAIGGGAGKINEIFAGFQGRTARSFGGPQQREAVMYSPAASTKPRKAGW